MNPLIKKGKYHEKNKIYLKKGIRRHDLKRKHESLSFEIPSLTFDMAIWTVSL